MVFCSPKQFHSALPHLNLKKSLHTQIHLANSPLGHAIFVLEFEGYRSMRFAIIFYYSFFVFCDSFS